jgi:hypothetical protein
MKRGIFSMSVDTISSDTTEGDTFGVFAPFKVVSMGPLLTLEFI